MSEIAFLATAEAVAHLGDFRCASDDDLLAGQHLIAAHERALDGIRARNAAEIARRSTSELGFSGLARKHGFVNTAALLQSVTGSSKYEASKLVRVAELLNAEASPTTGEVPWQGAVGGAVSDRRIGVDAAESIRAGLSGTGLPIDDALLSRAAETLLDGAGRLDVDQLHRRAREIRNQLDAAGIAAHEKERRDLRFPVVIGPRPGRKLTTSTTGVETRGRRHLRTEYCSVACTTCSCTTTTGRYDGIGATTGSPRHPTSTRSRRHESCRASNCCCAASHSPGGHKPAPHEPLATYDLLVSNLEKEPDEVLLAEPISPVSAVDILEPRDVPLGGPRAMRVRRTLPQRKRSLIGAWCFVDHYGPDVVSRSGGMTVPPHPHTGLQTVSWLFAGDIDHRDSVGTHATVRPGQLNLMTAGNGIAHSEVSLPATTVLHGAQLWVALPDASRFHAPFFEHYVPTPVEYRGATVSVFIGSLIGQVSTATTFSELVGAQLDIPAGATVELPVDPRFEHGVLVDAGDLGVDGEPVPVSHLGYVGTGRTSIRLTAGASAVRALLIGGAPLGESIVMWWNFIGRSHEEIVRFRTDWQTEVIAGTTAHGRFGTVAGYDGDPLPAPELPNVRLRPRD